jgi:hypothetical protein
VGSGFDCLRSFFFCAFFFTGKSTLLFVYMKCAKVRLHRYTCLKEHLSGSLAKAWNHTWLNKGNRG